MTTWRSWLLLTVCGLGLQGPAYSQDEPKAAPTLEEVLNYKPCEAKLSEYEKWWAANKAICDCAMSENKALQSRFIQAAEQSAVDFGAAVGGVGALCLLAAVYRKQFIPNCQRHSMNTPPRLQPAKLQRAWLHSQTALWN